MDMNVVWPDTYEGYIHQFQPGPTKFTSSSRSTEFKDIHQIENLSNDHKHHPNQHGALWFQYAEKLMETETTTWSEFPNGGKAIVEKILASGERCLWESQ